MSGIDMNIERICAAGRKALPHPNLGEHLRGQMPYCPYPVGHRGRPAAGLESCEGRMVGATGIEPVTPAV
jgi:hypothetical protein